MVGRLGLLSLGALVGFFATYEYPMLRLIFSPKTMPSTPYLAYGDANSTCEKVTLPPEARFNDCEHGVVWNAVTDKGETHKYLIIGCAYDWFEWNTSSGPANKLEGLGAIWIYDYTKPNARPRKLALLNYPLSHDFHPHGFAISPSNPPRLLVVNQAKERPYIEAFDLPSPSDLINHLHQPEFEFGVVHLKTLKSNKLRSPNSIAFDSPNSFYVTNDHPVSKRSKFWGPLVAHAEIWLQLRVNNIIRIQLQDGWDRIGAEPQLDIKTVARGLRYPNGIDISSDKKEVSVASSAGPYVVIYDRNLETAELKFKKKVELDGFPDNVLYGEDGLLYVATHPSYGDLMNFVAKKGVDAYAGTWAFAIDTKGSGPTAVRTTYATDGRGGGYMSGTTVFRHEDHFFVIGLHEVGILHCKIA